jgi:hypothetical protein
MHRESWMTTIITQSGYEVRCIRRAPTRHLSDNAVSQAITGNYRRTRMMSREMETADELCDRLNTPCQRTRFG